MVEYTDEYTIRLSVHFRQFDGYQFHFLEYPCRKEVRVGIKAVDNLTNAVNVESAHDAGEYVQKVLGDSFTVPAKEAVAASAQNKREHSFG